MFLAIVVVVSVVFQHIHINLHNEARTRGGPSILGAIFLAEAFERNSYAKEAITDRSTRLFYSSSL